jgi:uncharacterized protein YraI
MSSEPSMEETNIPEPPSASDSQGASSSGEGPPGPPPAPPELEELVSGALAPSQATGEAHSFELPDWQAFLRNRFILGGLAIVVVLLLIAVVLVVVGSGDGGPGPRSVSGATTPDSESTALPRRGLIGHVRTTATMRNGPGRTYAILGTIRRGARVSVVGRNADETWLQITYPAGSQLRGWVDAGFIEVTGDISQLAIAGPGAGPSVLVPTGAVPTVGEPVVPSPTQPLAAATATPSPSPTAAPAPSPTLTPAPTATPQPAPTLPALPTETPPT